jgi:uncharacterized membrane protein
MERLYKTITTSIVRGIIFLMPIGILLIILSKLFYVIKKVLAALDLRYHETTVTRAIINNLVIIFLLLFVCFLAGYFAKLQWGKKLIKNVEKNVLDQIPGYTLAKATAQDFLGIDNHEFNDVILYYHGEDIQLAFRVESVTVNRVMIFIPGVPKPRSGSILIVNKSKVVNTSLTTHEAFSIMRGMGSGAAILGKYINEPLQT